MLKHFLAAAGLLLVSVRLFSPVMADDQGTLIFEDNFDRNESQELTDEVGNGWGTNSKSRAGGNKQVDLRDGAMHITMHAAADHAVSVTHPAEFCDGRVEMKFMLENKSDSLGLNFADLEYKQVWAGHLFKVIVGVEQVELVDLKTGAMDLKTREARTANTLTKQRADELKTKSKKFSHKLEMGKWYTVAATVRGDTLSVAIDGKPIASFASEGMAHPTKRMLRLSIPKSVVVDDLKIFSLDKPAAEEANTPLRVLLVAGGCCHDYATQTQLLKEGIEKRMNARVTVELSTSTTTETTFAIYNSDDWAKGYDVVIHDECSANVTEQPYIDRILAAHRMGTPAVNLHCAMHSYRWGEFRSPVAVNAENARWYEMIGVQSTAHGAKSPIDIIFSDATHPITKGLAPWTTIDEELYNNISVYSGTTALVNGNQLTPPNKKELQQNPNSQAKQASAVVAWTNLYGPSKTRIFSTSLGHQNETVADAKYMDLVVRGLLWATDHITEDGKPTPAYVSR